MNRNYLDKTQEPRAKLRHAVRYSVESADGQAGGLLLTAVITASFCSLTSVGLL